MSVNDLCIVITFSKYLSFVNDKKFRAVNFAEDCILLQSDIERT